MSKVNGNDVSVVAKKGLKWSIEFDETLLTLFDSESIEDPGAQIAVCDALCRIGLAERRFFGEDTEQLRFMKNSYTSTKARWQTGREVPIVTALGLVRIMAKTEEARSDRSPMGDLSLRRRRAMQPLVIPNAFHAVSARLPSFPVRPRRLTSTSGDAAMSANQICETVTA